MRNNEVWSVRRLRLLSAVVALLASSVVLAACGDDDDSGNKSDGGQSNGDGGGGSGGKGHGGNGSDARMTPAAECEDEDGGAGDGCDDGYVCMDGECKVDYCGDGVKLGKEECDDGNVAGGDGCDPGCHLEKPAGCGDGKVQKGEECDDGNIYDADECTNMCTKNLCGDARLELDEECDDGNEAEDDDCSNDCLEIRCRNGRVDPGEECDDGNRINDDGCSNACKVVICRNGKIEGKEECDDGNEVDTDACSNDCTTNECGNDRVDPGEECDGFGCKPDCSGSADDDCRPCEEAHCTNYQDFFDDIAGCFDGHPDENYVPEVDPMFMQDCVDAITCTRQTKCGYNPQVPVIDCYCGSNDLDTCTTSGPADDAKCKDEWARATRGGTAPDVLLGLSDLTHPSGWAYQLLECDRMFCADVCLPK